MTSATTSPTTSRQPYYQPPALLPSASPTTSRQPSTSPSTIHQPYYYLPTLLPALLDSDPSSQIPVFEDALATGTMIPPPPHRKLADMPGEQTHSRLPHA